MMTGITHLIEHLALFPFDDQPHRYNGAVEGLRTVFPVVGSAREISEHFEQLSLSLKHLPIDRLWTEINILRTEAVSRGPGFVDQLLRLRYGPQWWGLAIDHEHYLDHPDPIAVQQWSDRWFTGENAAILITGSADVDLKLDLPSGGRKTIPNQPHNNLTMPAWLDAKQTVIAISMVAARSITLLVLQRILDKRVRRHLRHDLGVSYSVSTNYLTLSRDLAHITILADALPQSSASAVNGLIEVIEGIIAGKLDASELTDEVSAVEGAIDDPDAILTFLDRAATNELIGAPQFNAEDFRRELGSLTVHDLALLLSEAWGTAIALVPESVEKPPPGFKPVPAHYRRWTGFA